MFAKAVLVLPLIAWSLAAAAQPVAVTPLPSMVAPPGVAANPANKLTLELSNGGSVVIQLRPDLAPRHVEPMQTLIRRGFYDGLTFHRVIPGFMAQGGDPLGSGEGGSDLPDLKAEFSAMPFLRGTLGAARGQAEDSANSQFFIMFVTNNELDGNYTVMGRVIAGMDVVDRISPGEPPAEPTKIVRARLGG